MSCVLSCVDIWSLSLSPDEPGTACHSDLLPRLCLRQARVPRSNPTQFHPGVWCGTFGNGLSVRCMCDAGIWYFSWYMWSRFYLDCFPVALVDCVWIYGVHWERSVHGRPSVFSLVPRVFKAELAWECLLSCLHCFPAWPTCVCTSQKVGTLASVTVRSWDGPCQQTLTVRIKHCLKIWLQMGMVLFANSLQSVRMSISRMIGNTVSSVQTFQASILCFHHFIAHYCTQCDVKFYCVKVSCGNFDHLFNSDDMVAFIHGFTSLLRNRCWTIYRIYFAKTRQDGYTCWIFDHKFCCASQKCWLKSPTLEDTTPYVVSDASSSLFCVWNLEEAWN